MFRKGGRGYNFTERGRKVLANARDEAENLHHEYVGTEHILLGLARDAELVQGEGIAAAVLRNLGVDINEIRHLTLETVPRGWAHHAGPDFPYTSRGKKVIELAMNEASDLNHSYVGTEHLLLALLREEKGIAAQVLNKLGVTVENARAEMLRLLGNEFDGPEGSSLDV
jgi:ATP-dependent Clp protease ATP-binding subunit ClpC